jgi:hypothetical protein
MIKFRGTQLFIFRFERKSFLLAPLLSLVSACSSPHTEKNTTMWSRRDTPSSLVSKTGMPNQLKWLNKKVENPQDSIKKERWGENQIVERYLYDADHPGLTRNLPKSETSIESHAQWEKNQRYLRRNKND